MITEEFRYMLVAKKNAMKLFKQSKETLMNSENYDFMVLKFAKREGVQVKFEQWEGHVTIDEVTYYELYGNLCKKLRSLV